MRQQGLIIPQQWRMRGREKIILFSSRFPYKRPPPRPSPLLETFKKVSLLTELSKGKGRDCAENMLEAKQSKVPKEATGQD